MENNEIISRIKEKIQELEKEIEFYNCILSYIGEKSKNEENGGSTENSSVETSNNELQVKFKNYLINSKNLGSKTISSYFCGLRSLKVLIEEQCNEIVNEEIFNIKNVQMLNHYKNLLEDNDYLRSLNTKRHNIFSASLNNYICFISDYDKNN